jgi:hypothetical protein
MENINKKIKLNYSVQIKYDSIIVFESKKNEIIQTYGIVQIGYNKYGYIVGYHKNISLEIPIKN